MNTNNKNTLSSVLCALFQEYGNSKTVKYTTKKHKGDRMNLYTCNVLDDNFTLLNLVYIEFTDCDGTYSYWTLQLYPSEVSHDWFDVEGSNIGEELDPLITITVSTIIPTANSDTSKMDWIKGRGFWLDEAMTVYTGGAVSTDFTVTMIGAPDDIIAFFLILEIIKSAYQKALGIKIMGHWESDWDQRPYGKYLYRPSKTS
jgi:hypothetical protein